MDDFFPVILGSDENAYGNARLFYEAYGIRPLLLCERKLVATRYSRILTVQVIRDFTREEVFVKELLSVLRRQEKNGRKLLVIPCVDYYTELLVKNYDRFEGRIANRFLSKELLEKVATKVGFAKLAGRYGLDTPCTVVVEPGQWDKALRELPFPFPVVAKPENSNVSAYLKAKIENRKKVYYLQDEAEFRELARSVEESSYAGRFVIQERIGGGDDAIRVANTYSDASGKVRLIAFGQALLGEHLPTEIGNNAAIISRYDKEIMDRIRNFLEAIGYVGIANFDMQVDSRSGRIVFYELNPRPARTSFFLRAAGCNLMKVLTDDVVYGKREECRYVSEKALWSNVPLCVLKEHVKDPELRKEIRELVKSGKYMQTRYNREDPDIRRLLVNIRYDIGQIRVHRKYDSK